MKAHTTKTSANASTIIYLPPFCYTCKHVPATPTTKATATAAAAAATTRTIYPAATATTVTAPVIPTTTTTTATATKKATATTAKTRAKTSATGSGNVTTTTSTMAIAMTLASVGNTSSSSGVGDGGGSAGDDGDTGDISSGSDYGSCCQRCRWEHKNYDKHATPTLTPTTARKTFTTVTATTTKTTTTSIPAAATTVTLRRPTLSNVEATAPATAAAATAAVEGVEGVEQKDKGAQEENRITRNSCSRVGFDIVGGGEGASVSSCSCCIHWNFLQKEQQEQQQKHSSESKLQQQRIALTDTNVQCSVADSNACSKRPSDLKQSTRQQQQQQQQQRNMSASSASSSSMAGVHHVDAVEQDDDDDDDDDDVVGHYDVENVNEDVGNVNEKRAVDVSWFLADSIKLRNIQLVMPIDDAVGVAAVDAAECRLENVTTMQCGTSIATTKSLNATATKTTTAASEAAAATASAALSPTKSVTSESTTAATRQSYASLTQNNATATKTETTKNTTKTTKALAKVTATIKKASHTTTTPLLDECRCLKYNGDISTLEEISEKSSKSNSSDSSSNSNNSDSSKSNSNSGPDCCCEHSNAMTKVNSIEPQMLRVPSVRRQYKQQQEQEPKQKVEMEMLKDYQHLCKLKQQNERKLPRRCSIITLLKFWQQPQKQKQQQQSVTKQEEQQQLVLPKSQEATMASAIATATTTRTSTARTSTTMTMTTSTSTTLMATPTAPAVSRCRNLAAYAAKTMKAAVATTIRIARKTTAATAITKTTTTTTATTTTTTNSWLTLLVMLMLTTTANCWGGRQDVPTNCTFPARWEGSWFLSGYQQSIHIKGSQFSYRGRCAASDGNKYLIVDEKGCHRCLVIYEKHKNVLQYKESECEGDSMYMHQSNPSALAMRSSLKQSDHRGGAHPNTNGHSRLSSSDQYIMRSNDDMNDCPPDFCKGRETLQNLCDQIPGDALLYSLFRESAEPVKCPLKGPFIFTYNRGHGECKSPVSNIESCTEESRLLLSFQACPDVQGTESTVEELTCLATWKDGNSRYLVGLVSHHHAISNEERYRCFVYEKISSLMGGPSMLSSKDAEYKLAQSGDATCNGLDSAEVGSRIMSLRKPPLAERCDFPVWFKGPRHWHALMGNAVFNFHSNDGSVHIIKPNGYMETRALCEQINKQTATEMMAVVHYTTGCQSGFMCMMFYRRDTHVIEIQTGKPAIRLEDACALEYFDINKMAYITLLATNPDPQICLVDGVYTLRGAIGPPYLTTRHKRNHNNKAHLGHGHHHHDIDDGGSIGFGHKRHGTLSFRNAERMEKDTWHGNTRGLPVRSRRNVNDLKNENAAPQAAKQLLSGASNDTSVGFVSRTRRDVPGCVTNYKAQRQLFIGCTAPNVIDVRPQCNEEGEEEYSCHGSWIENGTVYIIARHKSTRHGVCISYRPTDGTAAKLVIGDACYRGTQKPPDHHLVSNLSKFGKCGETGSDATRLHIAHWLLSLAVCTIFAMLLADAKARHALR